MERPLIFFIVCFSLISLVALPQKQGTASYYAHNFHGRKTSSGEQYHKDSLTCAHRTLPFGTLLHVKNLKNNKSVIVKVTDRGPHARNRLIDLSREAAERLDMLRAGVVTVEIREWKYVASVPLLALDKSKHFLPVVASGIFYDGLKIKRKLIGEAVNVGL